MISWLLFSLGSAITQSWTQALSKFLADSPRYSKVKIGFISHAASSISAFAISYFFIGFPVLNPNFWFAVAITGFLNVAAFFLILHAYEIGEFSSVYSMILLTPVFLLITSIFFLKEIPTLAGVVGTILTVVGLWIISSKNQHAAVSDFVKGNLLGIAVALIWSISVNFDKLVVLRSDAYFGPAAITGFIAMGFLICEAGTAILGKTYLFATSVTKNMPMSFSIRIISVLILLGFLMTVSNIFFGLALLLGFASYTVAIKRTGLLFGIFWGWLFFHEKNVLKKFFGAIIAVLGIVLIIVT